MKILKVILIVSGIFVLILFGFVSASFIEFDLQKKHRHMANPLDKTYNFVYQPERHKKLLCLLHELDELCETNHIDYWLTGGSMLGCVRHAGFIPHDDDIDVAIKETDIPKLLQNTPDHLQIKYTTSKYHNCILKLRYRESPKAFIDIFPVELAHNDSKEYRPFYQFKDECNKKFPDQWYIDELYPLKKKQFCDIQVNVPNNSSAYLTRLFGDDCLTEMRVTHYHFGPLSAVFSKIRDFFQPPKNVQLTPELQVIIQQMNRSLTCSVSDKCTYREE